MNGTTAKASKSMAMGLGLALAALAAIPAIAQESVPGVPQQRDRVVLVSLVDRKLAVIDNGIMIAEFQGRDSDPDPPRSCSNLRRPLLHGPGDESGSAGPSD